MLSLFPALFAYEQIAPFIIRVVLGGTLLYFGYQKAKKHGSSSGSNTTLYGIAEIVIGIFLVIGLYTQLAALLNAAILVIKLGFKAREGKLFSDGINYYVLLLTLAVALIFLGPGFWGIDFAGGL